MSHTRHYFNFIIFSAFLVRTCFGQASCLPLSGSDANHPNGLLLQLVPAKQYSGPRQNPTSTYMVQLSNAAQVIWDTNQGVKGIPTETIAAALKTELTTCVPKPVNPTPAPPQSVPFFNTPLATSAHAMIVDDFNRDNQPDVVIAVPGSNEVSVYLGNADATFQAPIAIKIGNAATKLGNIRVADFNNDRKTDIAVADTGNNVVQILYGRGDGTFFTAADGPSVAPVAVPVGRGPVGLAVADINADGLMDMITTNTVDNTISVVRGSPGSTFIPALTLAVGKNPVSVIAQDFNADGILDLVVADSGSNDIALLIGIGNGGFQNTTFTKTPAPPTYLSSADFNNDGRPDIVALSIDANAVMMITGGFQGRLTFVGAYLAPNLAASVSVNDFDGDGNLDVLVPDSDTGSPVLLLGRGDGTLLAPPVYASANGFTSLATADLTGDGKTDLLFTGSNTTTSTLTLLPGSGNGQFQSAVNIPVSGRTDAVVVGDFNKDGRMDIAVSGAQLNILLNQGNNVFQSSGQYANMTPLAVGDFNKDGRNDIAGLYNGALGVMLGNGDGTFRAITSFPAGTSAKTAVAADFNRDSSTDIAVLNSGTAGNTSDPGGVAILLGNSAGSFGNPINVSTGLNPKALAAGDVNGDGRPDLVVATGTGSGNYQVSILLGKGDGTFQLPNSVPVPAGETPSAVAIVDLDGDGNPDIVLGDCCADSTTSYFRGNGDGTFQPAISFYGGNSVRAIAVGDWNSDGKADLALAYSPTGNPSVGGVTAISNRLGSVQALTNTSAASFAAGPLAPDSIVAAFGNNLTNGTASASGSPSSLPTTLANTTVTIKDSKGVSTLAKLYYVSPTQVNYLVPATTALGAATVSVASPTGVTAAQVNVIASAPGLFTANSSGLASGAGVHVSGGVQSAFNLQFVDASGNVLALTIFLGARTDQNFLTLYGTGFRNRSSLEGVVVSIGGVYTPALYAGPQSEYAGLDQLNVQIPQSLAGAGKVPIQLTVDGVSATPVFVVVQ